MASFVLNIDVPDLERAITFYTTAFDLRLGRRLGTDFAELLSREDPRVHERNVPIYLLQKPIGSVPHRDASTQRNYARHWTPLHLDFVVQDIAAALRRAELAGATRESNISEHAYGKLVLLADPFGHGVCLLQFNELGYDALAT